MRFLAKYGFWSVLIFVLCNQFATAQIVKLCMGDTLKATSNTTATSVTNYWYKDGAFLDTTTTIQLYEPGTYTVYCETDKGCVSLLSEPIIVSFDTLVATNDYRTTTKNTALDIAILDNDHIPECTDAESGTIAIITLPINGTASILPDGQVHYIPNTGFVGVDSFFYIFTDVFGNESSAWVFITIESPLQVTLLSFDAYRKDELVQLEWKVADEINIKNYTIEKSKDALQFESIGIVVANQQSGYSFQDLHPFIGNNYYRLRIIEADETYSFSEVRNVIFDQKNEIKVYPNPTQHIVNVDLGNEYSNVRNIQLSDVNGKKLDLITNVTQINSFDLSRHAAQVFVITVIQKDGNVIGSYKVNKL